MSQNSSIFLLQNCVQKISGVTWALVGTYFFKGNKIQEKAIYH